MRYDSVSDELGPSNFSSELLEMGLLWMNLRWATVDVRDGFDPCLINKNSVGYLLALILRRKASIA